MTVEDSFAANKANPVRDADIETAEILLKAQKSVVAAPYGTVAAAQGW